MNDLNLVPITQRPKSEAREISVKGGIASGKARRLKKAQREILREILSLEITEEEGRDLLSSRGLSPDIAHAINFAAAKQALAGSIEALRYIRDTIGEKPTDALEIGNLDDKPLETIDLTRLSDAQLMAMIARRKVEEEVDEREQLHTRWSEP